MTEIWKNVEGYEGYYQVSNLGRVKSLKRTVVISKYQNMNVEEKILAQREVENGYLVVGLSVSGKKKLVKVHRLVANAFIPNPENKLEVNHIDANKHNNKVDNLEWATHSENQKHAFKHGLYDRTGEHNSCNKLKTEEVIKIRQRKCNNESLQNVYKDYKDRLSIHGFRAIWYGHTWKHININ